MVGIIFFYLLLTVTTAFVVAFLFTLYQNVEAERTVATAEPDIYEEEVGLSRRECRKIVKRLLKEEKRTRTYFGRYLY